MKINNKIAANDLVFLPPKIELETKKVLKKAIKANKELAKLKGYCLKLPNTSILLNSMILNEAIASSEIENIITTHDKLFTALVSENYKIDPSTKEVLNYRQAVWKGYKLINKNKLLTTNIIIDIQETLEKNKAGIRKLPGTVIKNISTDEILFTPPDNEKTILHLLKNLENYINIDEDNIDPLIKMAVIHYQFESIHPFYDGNGRTGRIINILYLILKDLLDEPILYLSKYIIKNKNYYYKYLQELRSKNNWEDYILFILDAVEKTSIESVEIIESILKLLNETIAFSKKNLPKGVYSRELIEAIFLQPYTKVEFLVEKGIGERRTAGKYLKELEKIGVLESFKLWKENIYINTKLFNLLKKK